MKPVRFRKQECQIAAYDTQEYKYVELHTGGGGMIYIIGIA